MAFRFHKRVKVLPGVRLNFSKSGISTTIGKRGLSVNTGKRGTYINAGIPNTGLSYRKKISSARSSSSGQKQGSQTRIFEHSFNSVSKVLYIIGAIILFLIIGVFNSLHIAADTVTNICMLLLLSLIVIRFLSKAHKAKPYIKQAESYCRQYQYLEAASVLEHAYSIYPNDNIKQDLDDLEVFIKQNNIIPNDR